MAIKGTEIVEKRNILNELRRNSMSLQELRFFSIYLSKINARDPSTRKVTFPLSDFRKIMDLGRINIKHMQVVTNNLLSRVVNIQLPNGGYEAFQLFKRCKVYRNEYDQWFIDIDAHDDALPLMFEFKDKYFTYELWNALRLKSGNQLRMYELLKQYESIGERKIPLKDLRELLGIGPEEYPRWDNFKRRILDSCQAALAESTDICFEYTPIKAGKKITGIHFIIRRNTAYIDQLSLDEFLDQQPEVVEETIDADFDDDPRENRDDICSGFSDEIFDEFTDEQLIELRALAWTNVDPNELEQEQRILGNSRLAQEFVVAAYVRRKILMCNAKGDAIKSRYGYIKRAVEEDWK